MIMSTCPIFKSTCQKITYVSEWKLWSFWFCFWVFSNTIEYERTNGKSTDKVGMVSTQNKKMAASLKKMIIPIMKSISSQNDVDLSS